MDAGNDLSNSQGPELGIHLYVDEKLYAEAIYIINFEVIQEPVHKGLCLDSRNTLITALFRHPFQGRSCRAEILVCQEDSWLMVSFSVRGRKR